MTPFTKHDVLEKVFGFQAFRPKQEAIVDHVLQDQDALVILPTGGGKSLCYQLPAVLKKGVTVVISPLIALMEDQVQALRLTDIRASAWHSHISASDQADIRAQLEQGALDLLYCSPEKINTPSIRNMLRSVDVAMIAIDEAHCVSMWGNDFRPDYVGLSDLKTIFPTIPFIALTATADRATQQDILDKLNIPDATLFITSFERKNIAVRAEPGTDRIEKIVNHVRKFPEASGIIYCLSRKSTERVAERLEQFGFSAAHYHAGLSGARRAEVQKQFQEDKVHIICATIAFGMGIDKSNIRWIIHYNLPKNIEGYYQEIGRAGRDGSDAEALLFYSFGDIVKLRSFVDDGNGTAEYKKVQHAKLDRMWEYASATDCRVNLILNYFNEYRSTPCGYCDNCKNPPQKIDGTVHVQMALSAMLRCREALTFPLLVDVLTGSARREILEKGFNNIKTYGAGRKYPRRAWQHYITQAINKGIIRIDYVDRMRLKTTPLSAAVLKGAEKVALTEFVDKQSKAAKTRSKKTKKEQVSDALFLLLKQWRKRMADALGVPAYVVMTDKSLQQIATDVPKTPRELLAIDGVAQKRVDSYGTSLLETIHDFITTQDISKSIKGQRQIETYQAFKNGQSPEDIATEKSVKPLTIYGHLCNLYLEGMDIDLKQFITDEEIDIVRSAIAKSSEPRSITAVAEYILKPMAYHKIKIGMTLSSQKL